MNVNRFVSAANSNTKDKSVEVKQAGADGVAISSQKSFREKRLQLLSNVPFTEDPSTIFDYAKKVGIDNTNLLARFISFLSDRAVAETLSLPQETPLTSRHIRIVSST